jgi:hypothetical protein
MKDIKIRKETLQDIDAIRAINEKAFGQLQEANIVDRLRANCDGLPVKRSGVTFFQINRRSGLLENEGASGHPNDVS